MAGYSGTPLAKKLGIKDGHRVVTHGAPVELTEWLGELPPGVELVEGTDPTEPGDVVLTFHTARAELERELAGLEQAVRPDRALWIAWPKKTAKVETDLTGDVVRALVLQTRLVDVKVCAISDAWSGLKNVWRTEHRP